MIIDLYHFEPNANGGKPIIALNEKGIPFRSHWIDLLRFEQHSPAYLAINPKGQVPTLVHNGLVITESTPMGEYIDEAFEGPRLRPEDPLGRWRVRTWSKFADEYLGPSLSMVAWSRFIGPMMRQRDPADLQRALRAIPTEERRRAWSTTVHDKFTPLQLAESRRRMRDSAMRLNSALTRSSWLAGETYSLADINVFNMAGGLPVLLPEDVNDRLTPHLMRWLQRIRERPAVSAALALSRNSLRPAGPHTSPPESPSPSATE